MSNTKQYVPITPGGTVLIELAAETEDGAWTKLINDASHMPYKTKQNFINRGYTIGKLKD